MVSSTSVCTDAEAIAEVELIATNRQTRLPVTDSKTTGRTTARFDSSDESRTEPSQAESFRQALRRVERRTNEADLPSVEEAIRRRKKKMLDRARQFLAKNWSIFPTKVGEKKPAVEAYTPFCKRRATTQEVEAWSRLDDWCDLAVALGPASAPPGLWLAALDLDDPEAAAAWKAQAGPLDDCFVVRTSRGIHVYFLLPENAVPGQVVKLHAEGVEGSIGELRLHGVYVMAPDTLHMASTPDSPRFYRPENATLPNTYDLRIVRDIGVLLGEAIRRGTAAKNPRNASLATALGILFEAPQQSAFSIEVSGRVEERLGKLPTGEERIPRANSLSRRYIANEEDILWWLDQTTPAEKGNRDNQVFYACRHIKYFADGHLLNEDPDILDDLASRWFAYATKRRALSGTHTEDETIDAFHRAMENAEVPADAGNFALACEKARFMNDPPCFEARRKLVPRGFSPSAVLAYKLMHVLQERHWSDAREPFYISHQRLADFLGVSRPAISDKMARWRRYGFIEIATDWFPDGRTFVPGVWSTRYWYNCTCFIR